MLDTLQKKLELTEENFSQQLPEYLQRASEIYFTPLHVGVTAANWLTDGAKKNILDIGAGIGKFCIAGAQSTYGNFFGIEYRKSLAILANELIGKFNLKNAFVQHGNMMEIDFQDFDGFYMYNPFYENLIFHKRLNNEVVLMDTLYGHYLKSTELRLSQTKKRTRLVTYHGNNFEVPGSFKKVEETEGGALKFWIKE